MAVAVYQPIYTITEASKLLRVNRNFLYDEIKKGKLPALKLGSMKVRGTDLEKYIQTYPTTDQVEED